MDSLHGGPAHSCEVKICMMCGNAAAMRTMQQHKAMGTPASVGCWMTIVTTSKRVCAPTP